MFISILLVQIVHSVVILSLSLSKLGLDIILDSYQKATELGS